MSGRVCEHCGTVPCCKHAAARVAELEGLLRSVRVADVYGTLRIGVIVDCSAASAEVGPLHRSVFEEWWTKVCAVLNAPANAREETYSDREGNIRRVGDGGLDDTARPAQSPAGAVWQPMETEPYDGKFRLYGLHCSSRNGHNWFEVHYVALDGELIAPSGDSFTDWSHEDFEVWMDVPTPPPDSGAPR